MTKLRLRLLSTLAVPFAAAVVVAGQSAPARLATDAPFTVAVSTTTMEGGPVYVADEGPMGAGFRVINGGVRNLADGTAHAATNAETQLLIVRPPNVRVLMTLAEGLYRIVARRSAGIATLADLRGKRVILPRDTSAHYSLVRMLGKAGVDEAAVTIVSVPRERMADALAAGEADALSMWEPEAQRAVELLGADAVVFQDNSRYRELFNLYTTTEVLGDARRRGELVTFIRAVRAAVADLAKDPARHFPLIAKTIVRPEDLVARSWKHHRFPLAVVGDLVDVMVEEDRWIARGQKREPLSRAMLAALVDTTAVAEAGRGDRR